MFDIASADLAHVKTSISLPKNDETKAGSDAFSPQLIAFDYKTSQSAGKAYQNVTR
jgi:hypothetical protein